MYTVHYVKDSSPLTKSFKTAFDARVFIESIVNQSDSEQDKYYVTGLTDSGYIGAEMDYEEQKIITRLRFSEKREAFAPKYASDGIFI